ncbi:MAG: SAM-dependent methyltransferase [Chloroflexi bacterium]|nr:SAM-dependent methyltransferase [Chloroflexota bacterium]
MAASLYDELHGFYSRAPSRSGDYFTSVTVHPQLFGTLLARHLDDVWTALGKPRPFRVVELGCGDGTLARQLASAAQEHPWREHLAYVGVERSAQARARARTQVPTAAFVASLDAIDAGPAAAFISNELFDALPVRLLQRNRGHWVELRVGLSDHLLTLEPFPVDGASTDYALRYGQGTPDGGVIEMRKGVSDVYANVRRIAAQWVMTSIDYGGLAADVHGPRFSQGTMLAYRQHRASEDLLADPGASDLTAHVNFSELIDAGARAGATAALLGTQGDFLTALGIGEHLPAVQRRLNVSVADYAREREAVFQLVSPTDLGRFRVLVQARDAVIDGLRGLGTPAATPQPATGKDDG